MVRLRRRDDIHDHEVVDLFNKGLNYRQIATYFHTEPKIIIGRLKRNGICVDRLSMERRQDIKNEEVLKLYNEGKSTGQIATIFNTNNVTIRNRLHSCGVLLQKEFRDDIKNEDLIRLYLVEKLSTCKIARLYDTTAQLVKVRLGKEGIVLRSKLEAGDIMSKKIACVVCGMIFRPNGNNRKTCGDVCHSILMSEIQKGESSSNWKGGASQAHYQRILREEYVQICEICNKEKIRIDTHHEDKDHSNNKRENIHPWCVTCHAKYHYITDNRGLNGWNPNTPKLVEFKKRLDELGIPY
jgi:hypothetical protein